MLNISARNEIEDIRFSIIMPVFQTEMFVAQAIESIINQTCTNWELYLVHDRGNDDSGEICDAYATKDSRIKVFHRDKSDIGSARNMALDVCSGNYVIYVDSDDWVDSNYLSTICNKILEEPDTDIFLFDNYDEIDKSIYRKLFKGSKREFISKRDIEDLLLITVTGKTNSETSSHIAAPWAKVYSTKRLGNIRFPICDIEDLIYNLETIYNSNRIVYFSQAMYHYRLRNQGSAMHRYRPDRIDGHLALCSEMESFVNNNHLNENLYKAFLEMRLPSFTIPIINGIIHPQSEFSYIQQIEQIKSLFKTKYFKEAISLFRWSNNRMFRENILWTLLKYRLYGLAIVLMKARYYQKELMGKWST